jgi:hypothetical protein
MVLASLGKFSIADLTSELFSGYSTPPGSYFSFLLLVYFTLTLKGKISMLFLSFSWVRSSGTAQLLACAILSVFQGTLLHKSGELKHELEDAVL